MSIQAQLNQEALDYLPKIKNIISNSDSFTSNQIRCYALREIMNSFLPIASMNKNELNRFENELISSLRFKEII